MNRFAAMHDWPVFVSRPAAQTSAAAVEVGILEHDVGIAAAQLEHGLLQRPSGGRGHRRPAGVLPVNVTARTWAKR